MPPITFGQLPLTAFNPIHEKKLSFLRAVKNHQRKGRREKIMTWKITSDSMDKSFMEKPPLIPLPGNKNTRIETQVQKQWHIDILY